MVIPALPTLQQELGTTTTWVTWVLTGFLLSASVATPLLGKLGDQHGKERLLVISLGLFFLGSVGATFAWDISSLIGCRIVQGAGGAVFPLSFSIIKDEFPREKVGVAVGVVSAVFGVGGGLGLVLSGLIVDHLSWRWIFAPRRRRRRDRRRARPPVRARVAGEDAVAPRPAGRAAALRGARLAPDRAQRGRASARRSSPSARPR